MSAGAVEARLVEAMRICWRLPDRERGWQRVRAYWPEMKREEGFGDDKDYGRGGERAQARVRALAKPSAVTREEVTAMEEAWGWLERVRDDDRRLIGAVVRQMAREGGPVNWAALVRNERRWRSADGLRMRYGRAMASLAKRVNVGRVA